MKTITQPTYRVLCDLCDTVLWDSFLPKDDNGESYKTITVAGRTFWIRPLYPVHAEVSPRPSIYQWMVETKDDPWQIRFTRTQNVWFAPAGLRRGLVVPPSPPETIVVDRFPVRFVGDRHVFQRDMLAVKMFLVKDEDCPVARAV